MILMRRSNKCTSECYSKANQKYACIPQCTLPPHAIYEFDFLRVWFRDYTSMDHEIEGVY